MFYACQCCLPLYFLNIRVTCKICQTLVVRSTLIGEWRLARIGITEILERILLVDTDTKANSMFLQMDSPSGNNETSYHRLMSIAI